MHPSSPNVLAFRSPHVSPSDRLPDVLLGPSPAIARVWSQIRRVAPYFRTALLAGERGAGHEAVAHALHSLSPRSTQTLITIPAADADAFLAGDASARLNGDSFFLPDVETLSTVAQTGLLRLMRQRRPRHLSIIAGACGDLRPHVSAGAFSSMLAAALSGLQIGLPPLRERTGDIPALATHMLLHEARALNLELPPMSSSFLDALSRQPWPGNLGQLQSVLRRMVHEHTTPDATGLEAALKTTVTETPVPASDPVRLVKLEDVVQGHIRSVLVACNGNKLRAAEVLGISRSTLYRMLDSGSVSGHNYPVAV